jgi:hypothetical protein
MDGGGEDVVDMPSEPLGEMRVSTFDVIGKNGCEAGNDPRTPAFHSLSAIL